MREERQMLLLCLYKRGYIGSEMGGDVSTDDDGFEMRSKIVADGSI